MFVNHFAQNVNFNRGAYKRLENTFQRALDNNQKVEIEIEPFYSGSSSRPDELDVYYSIDGVPYLKSFINQHGG